MKNLWGSGPPLPIAGYDCDLEEYENYFCRNLYLKLRVLKIMFIATDSLIIWETKGLIIWEKTFQLF